MQGSIIHRFHCSVDHCCVIHYSAPLYAINWIYFSSSAGRSFLHHCDVVHKFSEDVIVQRREELLLKV